MDVRQCKPFWDGNWKGGKKRCLVCGNCMAAGAPRFMMFTRPMVIACEACHITESRVRFVHGYRQLFDVMQTLATTPSERFATTNAWEAITDRLKVVTAVPVDDGDGGGDGDGDGGGDGGFVVKETILPYVDMTHAELWRDTVKHLPTNGADAVMWVRAHAFKNVDDVKRFYWMHCDSSGKHPMVSKKMVNDSYNTTVKAMEAVFNRIR